MRESFFEKSIPKGCLGTGGVLAVILFFLVMAGAWGWMRYLRSSQTMTITDFTQTHAMSVHAPVFPFCSGAVWVLYEGTISTSAMLEIVSEGGGKKVIPLQAGEVGGVYGGAEDWSSGFSVRLAPSKTVRGTLKITAICGRNFTDEEREWFYRLYEIERGQK